MQQSMPSFGGYQAEVAEQRDTSVYVSEHDTAKCEFLEADNMADKIEHCFGLFELLISLKATFLLRSAGSDCLPLRGTEYLGSMKCNCRYFLRENKHKFKALAALYVNISYFKLKLE